MAKITPIDVIKGISGKYGNGSNDYFATNKSSNKIRLAKFAHPFEGDPTEKQLAQQSKFKARVDAVKAWLAANRPSEKNGDKGTEAYQLAQKIKRQLALSNVNQVLYKYMDEKNAIVLPEGTVTAQPSSGGNTQTGGNSQTGGGTSTGGSTSGGSTSGSSDDDDEEIIHE